MRQCLRTRVRPAHAPLLRNYEGPHHHDVALRDEIDIGCEARPAAIAFEAANPRHEHEWTLFEDMELPEGKAA